MKQAISATTPATNRGASGWGAWRSKGSEGSREASSMAAREGGGSHCVLGHEGGCEGTVLIGAPRCSDLGLTYEVKPLSRNGLVHEGGGLSDGFHPFH